ncbi:MAG: O-antigen ligase family protein [Candidatus Wallbacteria bacterium]
MALDMDVIKKFLLDMIFYISVFFMTIFPSLFSRYSYLHSDAPKEFALIMFSAIGGFLLCFYIISDFFSNKKSKSNSLKPTTHYIAFFFYLFMLSLIPSYISSFIPEISGYEIILQLSAGVWFLILYFGLYDNIGRVEILLKAVLISGIFPAVLMIMELFGASVNIWQTAELTGGHSATHFISTFGSIDYSAPFFGFLSLLNARFILYSDEKYGKTPYWILQSIYFLAFLGPLGRSSLIALLVAGLFYFVFVNKISSNKTSDIINILTLAAAVFFAVQLKDMFFMKDETLISRLKALIFNTDNIYERFYMLKVGAAIIYDNIWLGAGPGTLLMAFPLYARNIAEFSPFINSISPSFNAWHLHNEFFNIAVEYGVISLSFYILTITSAIYFLMKPVLKKGVKGELNLLITSLILFLIVDSLFNVTMACAALKFMLAALLAFAAAISLNDDVIHAFKFKFSGKFISPMICIMLFSFCVLSEITGMKYFLADWYLMQGKILEQMKHDDRAVECYSNSIVLFSGRSEPFYYRSILNEKKGDFENAVNDLKAASNLNLSLPVAYKLSQMAVNYLDMNSQLRYILFLTRAYPRFDEAHYMLGMRYLKESTVKPEMLENALKSFEKTISINAKHVPAIIKSAEICYETRNFYKCNEFLNTALEINPKDERALYLKKLCRGFFY